MSSEVRYACFDAVRACAIVLIMVCHWSRGGAIHLLAIGVE